MAHRFKSAPMVRHISKSLWYVYPNGCMWHTQLVSEWHLLIRVSMSMWSVTSYLCSVKSNDKAQSNEELSFHPFPKIYFVQTLTTSGVVQKCLLLGLLVGKWCSNYSLENVLPLKHVLHTSNLILFCYQH